jgi:ribulose-5-phosphate 4-epimerase/fuculose-1-phosphate aldolase
MADALATARRDLAIANRIIALEGVLDAFGHVSLRHPSDPGRYLLSRTRAPELIEADDIMEYTLDSQPVVEPKARMYGERVIHGCVFDARADVNAVCHHHAAAVMPYCLAGVPLVPVYHQGAVMGDVAAPFWDSRDEFGETNQMVITPEEGRSHARALGAHWIVLLRRHGATVVGRNLKEMVFRSVYSARNAEFQTLGMAAGKVDPLTPKEARLAGERNLQPNAVERAWEFWVNRLERDGRLPKEA